MPERLYLDHAATTPLLPVARAAMIRGLEIWANPSSPHTAGRAARAALEDARERMKIALDWPGEIIFTSGTSESVGIAMTRTYADAVLVGATEHDAVQRHAEGAVALPVATDGLVAAHVLAGRLGAIAAKLPLVVLQSANSETGVVQQLDDVTPLVRQAGGLLFVDASQSAGKLVLPDADLIAVSAHKAGGPPGIGALLVRDFAMLKPSGGQERGYRGGTENLPGAMAMVAALENPRSWVDRAGDLRAHLDGAIEAAGGLVVAKTSPRIATIAAYRMPGVASAAQLIKFDLAGIAISAGSACSSGSLKPSHVLSAMGWRTTDAGEVVRVSFGPETTRADVYRFVDAWRAIFDDARERA